MEKQRPAAPSLPVSPGGQSPVLDDEDVVRRRLIEAASRCIVRRGSARIRMGEVATEARVARSTLYRYYPTRGDLIIGLFLGKVDAALDAVVASLPHPESARESLPALVLGPLAYIEGNPVNEALFSAESRDYVASLQLHSESLFEASYRHFAPLLQRWQADGQLHGDLDLRDAGRWIDAISLVLLNPPWSQRSIEAQRGFLHHYLVRALVVPEHW